MRYIITGASGAIGHSLLKELDVKKNIVTVLVNPNSNRNKVFKIFPNVKIVECSLMNYSSLSINDKYDVYIHMAWQGGNDRKNILVNNASCMSSLDAVDMAQKLGCKLFISTGSQAEYGYQNQVLNEETICKPNTPFGAAKLCSFHYTKLRCKELGIQHLWLRIGSVYGPFDRESTMLLSSIRTINRGKLPVFSEGTQYWDFLYSEDIAKAIIKLVQAECSGLYVIGEGSNLILKDYLKIFSEELKFDLSKSIGMSKLNKKHKINNLRINPSKIMKDASWSPSVDFRTGIKKLINYSINHDPI